MMRAKTTTHRRRTAGNGEMLDANTKPAIAKPVDIVSRERARPENSKQA
ncbi:MAG: hypothetical protein OEV30_02215 [Ignavibacteria bacterium]|nr:hypothetical protein [Ignavibacteria bacterium]